MSRRPARLVSEAHRLVEAVLGSEDTAVDCTSGNGFDTAFLAVRAKTVLAIDICPAAIEATSARCRAAGLGNVRVVRCGHERLAELLTDMGLGRPRAVMFNLGYLPRPDRSSQTSPVTTVRAIGQATDAVAAGGIVTILAYRGHPGGTDECNAVADFVGGLDAARFDVERVEGESASSPILWAITRRT